MGPSLTDPATLAVFGDRGGVGRSGRRGRRAGTPITNDKPHESERGR